MKSAETPTSILVSGRPPKPAAVGAYGGPLLYKSLERVLGYRSISPLEHKGKPTAIAIAIAVEFESMCRQG